MLCPIALVFILKPLFYDVALVSGASTHPLVFSSHLCYTWVLPGQGPTCGVLWWGGVATSSLALIDNKINQALSHVGGRRTLDWRRLGLEIVSISGTCASRVETTWSPMLDSVPGMPSNYEEGRTPTGCHAFLVPLTIVGVAVSSHDFMSMLG